MTTENILLASGGMDSTTLAYHLKDQKLDFVPLFIHYGQHCADTELATLRKVLPEGKFRKIEIVDISSVYKYSSSRFIKPADLWSDDISANDLYIPYRNILLLTVGASFAHTLGGKKVYSAFINSNHAKEIDCSNDFFNSMDKMIEGYGTISIEMPFRYFTKYEVARLGVALKAPIGVTFSCQASPVIPCGACPNCVDRLEAIRKIEIEDIDK